MNLDEMISEDDLGYEIELERDPYSLRAWMFYINNRLKRGDKIGAVFVWRRALSIFPGCYKLWKAFLDFYKTCLIQQHDRKEVHDFALFTILKLSSLYKECLLFMHNMPVIWLDYLEFLCQQGDVLAVRKAFDDSLKALPITLHERIWIRYVRFAQNVISFYPLTAYSIIKRYLQIAPNEYDTFSEVFMESGASIEIFLDDSFSRLPKVLKSGDTEKIEFLFSKIYQNAEKLRNLKRFDDLLIEIIKSHSLSKSGNTRSYSFGRSINFMAMSYLRISDFNSARRVWWTALGLINNHRDFILIFDSITLFEETIIESKIQNHLNSSNGVEVFENLQHLMNSRHMLLIETKLRGSPNSGKYWLERAILETSSDEKLRVFERAIKIINFANATDLACFWSHFAQIYLKQNDVEAACSIFEQAIKSGAKDHNDLVSIWIEYGRLLISFNYQKFNDLMARAVKNSFATQSERFWEFYCNGVEEKCIVEKIVEPMIAVYEKMFDLKVIKPQNAVNYAIFLEEAGFIDLSSRVYEKAIHAFGWPVAFEFWNLYIPKFESFCRKSEKGLISEVNLENIRELYEAALNDCKDFKYSSFFYIQYFEFEDKYGSSRKSLQILDRACKDGIARINFIDSKGIDDLESLYRKYIDKIIKVLGAAATRDAYLQAIKSFPENNSRDLCLEFAELEAGLGEYERARAIYGFGAQFTDPRINLEFWKRWEEFELSYGNEMTYKDMLRLKRTVEDRYERQAPKFVASTKNHSEPTTLYAPNKEEVKLDV